MQARLFIDDTPGISVTEMRSKARRLKQQERPPRPHHRRLPAAHVGRAHRRQALREPHPGSVGHLARTESRRQGVEGPRGGALAVKPRSRKPRRRPSSATLRPARIRLHRAGRRRRGLHLPRRGVQEEGRSPTSKASPKSSSPNSATAPPASSSWPSSTLTRFENLAAESDYIQ